MAASTIDSDPGWEGQPDQLMLSKVAELCEIIQHIILGCAYNEL